MDLKRRPAVGTQDLKFSGIVRSFSQRGSSLEIITDETRRAIRQFEKRYYRKPTHLLVNPHGIEDLPDTLLGLEVIRNERMPSGKLYVNHVDMDWFK